MGEVGKLTTAERAKTKRLADTYNQTLEEHNAKRAEQRNACAICRRPFSQYQAFQDHDHECCTRHRKESLNRYCGKCNRGLVCFLCNRKYIPMIERMLKDHVDPVDVVNYIRDHQNQIKLRGGYAPKAKTKAKSKPQRKQKSVRRRYDVSPADGPPAVVAEPSSKSRTSRKWRVSKPGKAKSR